jgi:hypothetical protein
MVHPTTDKLRHEINRGRGAEKLEVVDPPAAPLGTDDEAAGMPPSRHAIKQAYDQEIFGRRVSPARPREDYAVPIFLAAVATVVSFVAFSIWLS